MNDHKPNVRELLDRTVKYSVRIMRLYRALQRDSGSKAIARQLLRAETSVGANLHEAQGAQSKAEFVAKIYIAYKEAREAAYWFRVIREAELIKPKRIDDLADETGQLVKILSSILLTAKQGRAK